MRKPLRLAIVSYGLPVVGQKRGGIERAAHTLAEGLARRGHQVAVFTHDPRPDDATYMVRCLPWKSFVSTWLGRRVTMGYLGNILNLLPDYRGFDAVVMNGDSLFAPLIGRPVLRILHGSALGEARSATSILRAALQTGVYVQELLSALFQRGVVAGSENSKRFNPFAQHVVPYGVDDAIFHPRSSARSPEPSIVFVGSMDGRKRGQFLLDGFLGKIRRRHPSCTLTIVGANGPAHPGVSYLTGIADAQLAALYQRSWVYASPSTYEGFGLPYLEAMACGTPVVATANPGSAEVLEGGDYGLMPPDSSFASTLSDLLADEGRRAAMQTAGLKRAQEYSLSRMLDGYEQILVELTGVHADAVASV